MAEVRTSGNHPVSRLGPGLRQLPAEVSHAPGSSLDKDRPAGRVAHGIQSST